MILVVDQSRSMEARDVRPTRLAAAQAAVHTFLDRVPRRLRVGLVVFAGEAHVAAPPTTDRELLGQAVDQIGQYEGFGGTAIGDALAAAVALGRQALTELGPDGTVALELGQPQLAAYGAPISSHDGSRGLVSILFLSDGAQTRGMLQPLEGAQRAKQAGMRVYTVALGTPYGTVTRGFGGGFGGRGGGFGPDFGPRRIRVPPDPETLRAIAETTGGRFTEARSADALAATYEALGSSLGREPGRSEVTFAFVGAAAVLLLLAGLLSALWSPRFP